MIHGTRYIYPYLPPTKDQRNPWVLVPWIRHGHHTDWLIIGINGNGFKQKNYKTSIIQGNLQGIY